MSGNKNSGRKRKSLSRENAMRRMTMLLPGAIDTIEETISGTNKDRLRYESAVEIKDSVMGKPKQQVDLSAVVQIEEPFFIQLFRRHREELETRKQIGGGNATIKEERQIES